MKGIIAMALIALSIQGNPQTQSIETSQPIIQQPIMQGAPIGVLFGGMMGYGPFGMNGYFGPWNYPWGDYWEGPWDEWEDEHHHHHDRRRSRSRSGDHYRRKNYEDRRERSRHREKEDK